MIVTLKIDGSGSRFDFVNYGTLKLNSYKPSTNGTTLINHGTIEVENIDGNNNTNIKNGCYLKVWKITIWYACYGKYFRSYLQRIDG